MGENISTEMENQLTTLECAVRICKLSDMQSAMNKAAKKMHLRRYDGRRKPELNKRTFKITTDSYPVIKTRETLLALHENRVQTIKANDALDDEEKEIMINALVDSLEKDITNKLSYYKAITAMQNELIAMTEKERLNKLREMEKEKQFQSTFTNFYTNSAVHFQYITAENETIMVDAGTVVYKNQLGWEIKISVDDKTAVRFVYAGKSVGFKTNKSELAAHALQELKVFTDELYVYVHKHVTDIGYKG